MFTASCHCGAITIELQRKPRKLTQCNCSICRRYGAIWAYYQRKSVRVRCKKDALDSYTWRNKRFRFYRCADCGCVTHYQRTKRHNDGSDMGAVNLRNIDDPSIIADVPVRLLDGAQSWRSIQEEPFSRVCG